MDQSEGQSEGHSDEEDDDDSENGHFAITGRISHNNTAILSQTFAQIDEVFGDREQQTKLSARRLLHLYNSHRNDNGGARAKSHWNMYQSYFQQHQDEECARLDSNELKGMSIATRIISRAWLIPDVLCLRPHRAPDRATLLH